MVPPQAPPTSCLTPSGPFSTPQPESTSQSTILVRIAPFTALPPLREGKPKTLHVLCKASPGLTPAKSTASSRHLSPHFCTVCLSHVVLSAVEGFLFPLSPTLHVFQIKHRFLWGLRSCPSSLVGWLLLVLVFAALRTSFCGVDAYLFV